MIANYKIRTALKAELFWRRYTDLKLALSRQGNLLSSIVFVKSLGDVTLGTVLRVINNHQCTDVVRSRFKALFTYIKKAWPSKHMPEASCLVLY